MPAWDGGPAGHRLPGMQAGPSTVWIGERSQHPWEAMCVRRKKKRVCQLGVSEGADTQGQAQELGPTAAGPLLAPCP